MADQRITSFPISELLKALGARKGPRRHFYHSPYREDKDASLHIDPDRNIWYDHGTGEGGGNVGLVMKCKGCTAKAAAEYILSLSAGNAVSRIKSLAAPTGVPRISHSAPNRIVRVRYLQSPYLMDYLLSRGIPAPLAARYCREVTLRGKTAGRTYDHIGFPNNSGGYALKAPSGFKSTTKGGITTIDTHGDFTDRPSSPVVSVFEGFMDFLSWLASFGILVPTSDVLVLNSVANLSRAIPYLRRHGRVICCLDNDDAGRLAVEKLHKELYDSADIGCASFYEDYKDVNEWWMAIQKIKE